MVFGSETALSWTEGYFFHFNRKLLLTTLTLLSAIAAPAIMGSNRNPLMGYSIPAAIGMPMIL